MVRESRAILLYAALLLGSAATPAWPAAIPAGSILQMPNYSVVTNSAIGSWGAFDSVQASYVPLNPTLTVSLADDPGGNHLHSAATHLSLTVYASSGVWIDAIWAFSSTSMHSYGWNGGGCSTITVSFPGAAIQGLSPPANTNSACGPATWDVTYYGQTIQTLFPAPTGLGLAVATVTLDASADFWGPGDVSQGGASIAIGTIAGDNPGVLPVGNILEPASLALVGTWLSGLAFARCKRVRRPFGTPGALRPPG